MNTMVKQSAPGQAEAASRTPRQIRLAALVALAVTFVLSWQATGDLANAIVTTLISGLCLFVVFGLTTSHHSATAAAATTATSDADIEQAALQERLGYRADILDAITASEPRAVILADKWDRILFANREAARRIGRDSEALIGSTMLNIFGEEPTRMARERLHAALKSRAPVMHIDREGTGSLVPRIIQTSYIPLADTDHIKSAVLITETDITALMSEREQRERMFRQLLDVCVALVDRRDPFAAGHSALVGSISRTLAGELMLDPSMRDTAEISGLLMNFGKVLVPQEILTKQGALTPGELKLVRDSMMSSADVLSIVQFGLPVVDTLRQVHEHVDGTGMPEGRRDEHIIVTARLCAIVNAFVAMISTRAHRAGMSVERALGILQNEAGKTFDGQIVAALATAIADGKLVHELDRVQRDAQLLAQREKKLTADALRTAATETATAAAPVETATAV